MRQQKTVLFFTFILLSVTHITVARGSTPSRSKQGQRLLGVLLCVQFQHSSLHCFGSSLDLQNLVKIKPGFP
jgi:hypothetical protein